MKELFDSEAKCNQVYPLLPLRELIRRPEDKRKVFVFRNGVERLADTMNVHTGAGTGYIIRAEVENPGNVEGVLLAQARSPKGERSAGGWRCLPFPGSGKVELNGSEQAHTSFLNIPASRGYWSPAESLDVGSDLGSAVSKEYSSPARFTGTINTITH